MSMRLGWIVAGLAGTAVLIGHMKAGGASDEGGLGDTDGRIRSDRPDAPLEASAGIDIGVSRLGLGSSGSSDDFHYWGTSGGIRAFSIASTSCNWGTLPAQWTAGSTGNHPVISQSMYRFLDGRFEQIGQSWLKHSFCAVDEFTCGACQPNGNCNFLAVGCADTYWATLNDGQDGGPKSQINPLGLGSGGTHSHPYASPSGPASIRGRLQITDADILAGGRNFAEVHYVTHDEPLANRHNNASWREVDLTLTSISGVEPGQGSVHAGQPAIRAWRTIEPGVVVVTVDSPDQGRLFVGYHATDNGDGTWHYEYAVYNLNAANPARSFSVPIPPGLTVTNVGFHDVDYHSGEPYDGLDWPAVEGGGQMTWSTASAATNANALRWGTLYNFRFDADAPPGPVDAMIVFSEVGGQGPPGGKNEPPDLPSLTVGVDGPFVAAPCPADTNGDGQINVLDLIDLLLCFGQPAVGGCAAQDTNSDGSIDVLDLIDLLLAFGQACP